MSTLKKDKFTRQCYKCKRNYKSNEVYKLECQVHRSKTYLGPDKNLYYSCCERIVKKSSNNGCSKNSHFSCKKEEEDCLKKVFSIIAEDEVCDNFLDHQYNVRDQNKFLYISRDTIDKLCFEIRDINQNVLMSKDDLIKSVKESILEYHPYDQNKYTFFTEKKLVDYLTSTNLELESKLAKEREEREELEEIELKKEKWK